MRALDDFDRKLLNQLRQSNRTSAEELGRIVNLSTSAVQRRLKRLREDKIIEADVSIISPAATGFGISCVVEITLHLGNSKVIDSFKALMSDCDEVTHCYYVTGAVDFVVILNALDMAHYEELSRKYFMDNPDVKQFSSHIVIDRVKLTHSPPAAL